MNNMSHSVEHCIAQGLSSPIGDGDGDFLLLLQSVHSEFTETL